MKINKTLISICMLPALAFNTTALAQETNGFSWGIEAETASDDNVLKTTDANAKSDSYISLKPQFALLGLQGKHKYDFAYQGNFSVFNKSSDFNYSDHNLKARALFDHSQRINTEFTVSFKDEIEQPGSTNTIQTELTEFNEKQASLIQGKIYYGSFQSTGQLVLALTHNKQAYKNNQQEFRDVDKNQATGTFFYRIAPKSRMLFEATYADYDYQNNSQFIDQSSKQALLLAGYEWQVTAKTTSVFKIGYQNKDFDNEAFNDISGLSYFLDMYWKPSTRTQLKLGGSRKTTESADNTVSGFFSSSISFGVEHAFNGERTKISSNYSYAQDDITYAANRKDKRHNANLSLSHSLREWLDVAVSYRFLKRDSNFALSEFESNQFGLSLTAKFD